MSRPSVHRGKYERRKDVALMWLIDWLSDVHASLDVIQLQLNALEADGIVMKGEDWADRLQSPKTSIEHILAEMEEA